jgi:surface antigen
MGLRMVHLVNSRAVMASAVALGMFTWGPAAHATGNMGFLRDAPTGRFDSNDWELLGTTTQQVLNSVEPTAASTWQNAENGHRGRVSALESYRSRDGRSCKALQIDTFADGLQASSRHSLCRDADGQWHSEPQAPARREAIVADEELRVFA